MRRRTKPHGSAILSVMGIIIVLTLLVAALLYYVGQTRIRAINQARAVPRNYCVETGLQLARAYFGQNYTTSNGWNNYLGNPSSYNPVPSSWLDGGNANPLLPALQAAHPELFADLDGDGKPDVYIYIRDNPDELDGGTENWQQDNDLNAYVGAVCISSTLVPRMQNGVLDPAEFSSEALLRYNGGNPGYQQRCGTTGNCNLN